MLGLGFGLLFGFLLQRSGVSNYDVLLNTLLLRDLTVVKVMLSAVATGALGIHLLNRTGHVSLHIRPAALGSNVIGGLIFGVGMALLGYCPGTIVAAVGEGRLDALLGGVVGMIIGSALFAAVYSRVKPVLQKGAIAPTTLYEALRVNVWLVVIPVCAIIICLLFWFENLGL